MQSFLAALSCLTVLPVHYRTLPSPAVFARSRFWYPVVALGLGTALGLWAWLVHKIGLPYVGSFLVLTAWVALTGGLHFDGFCSFWDGMLGGQTPEDRLQIMKDPRLGSFGLAAAVLLLLGKLVALAALADGKQSAWIIASAVVVARCLALCMAAGSKYPRPEGTGKTLIEATRGWEAYWFGTVSGVATLGGALGAGLVDGWYAAGVGRFRSARYEVATLGMAWAITVLVVILLTRWCRRRLGGVTGDCLGAAIETAEVVFLLAAVSFGALLPYPYPSP